jgi:PleD family two-component response regulator
VDACLKAADDALYRGKAEGRDRVVTARPPG